MPLAEFAGAPAKFLLSLPGFGVLWSSTAFLVAFDNLSRELGNPSACANSKPTLTPSAQSCSKPSRARKRQRTAAIQNLAEMSGFGITAIPTVLELTDQLCHPPNINGGIESSSAFE
jgi:hypothetical protein